jgi:hypothetical protein
VALGASGPLRPARPRRNRPHGSVTPCRRTLPEGSYHPEGRGFRAASPAAARIRRVIVVSFGLGIRGNCTWLVRVNQGGAPRPSLSTPRRSRYPALVAQRSCLAFLPTLLLAACGGGLVESHVNDFRSDDFPSGDAFVFGVALDPRTGAGLEDLPVTLTPSDGLPLAEELASPVQAETRANKRGEFAFSGIAPGLYVLFVRFDGNHKGYGEAVAVVEGAQRPFEARVLPPPLDVHFVDPQDGGTVAASDTAHLAFARFRVADLLTVTPETHPLYARVTLFGGNGGRPSGADLEPAGAPIVFETALDDSVLRTGETRVPIEPRDLGPLLRLESAIGIHVVYRDPRGGDPQDRDIRGEAILVERR